MLWRIKKWLINNLLFILTIVTLTFSPLIAWIIIRANWSIINFFYISNNIDFYSYYKSTIAGVFAIIAAIVTFFWYYVTIKQKSAKQLVYIIDQILFELRKNYKFYNQIKEGNANLKDSKFSTIRWKRLKENVTLLPRNMYTELSLLYQYFEESNKSQNINELDVEISYSKDIIEKLSTERKNLRFWYEIRSR